MALLSLCPLCSKQIEAIKAVETTIEMAWKPARKGLLLQCPHCNGVLGCQVDPFTIRSEVMNHFEQILDDKIKPLTKVVGELGHVIHSKLREIA